MKLLGNLIRNQQVEGSIPPAGSRFPLGTGVKTLPCPPHCSKGKSNIRTGVTRGEVRYSYGEGAAGVR
jgi:hypothetical protein